MLRRPDRGEDPSGRGDLSEGLKQAIGEQDAGPSRCLVEQPADLLASVTALARGHDFSSATARPVRLDEMRPIEQRGARFPTRTGGCGKPGERLVLWVIPRGDPLNHAAQVRKPAKTSPRSGV